MSKKSTSANITSDNTGNNNSSYSYNVNTRNSNQQDFTDSINRSLDQTKDNINRSIEESRSQIPQYNNIVNTYQEQTLQAAREISEHFIDSQKTIINSIQSAWRPFNQNINTTVNSWNSPEAAANAYSRFVSTIADNAVSALRTTNNIIFSNFDSWKSVLQQAKENSKQIFNQNVNVAKTIEQNSREIARAAQDTNTRFNSSINNNTSDSNTNTLTTTTSTSGNTSTTNSANSA
jgi:gas vesicle protein